NVEIKIQNHDLKTEVKEYKKLLLESDKALQTLHQNGSTCLLQHGMSPSEEAAYRKAINRAEDLSQENDRIQRKFTEQQSEIKRLREFVKMSKPDINLDDDEFLDQSIEHKQLIELVNRDNRLSGDQNNNIATLKESLRKEKGEKQAILFEAEGLRQQLLNIKNQMADSNISKKGVLEIDDEMTDDWEITKKINEAIDKARQEEIEKNNTLVQQLKAQITSLNKQLASQTSENDDLCSELELIKSRPLSTTSSRGDISSRFLNGEFSEQYEESLGHLRDKVAELTLQLREKSVEVEQLVIELERNTLAHSTSVQDFEDQYEEEIVIMRDQLDVLQNDNEQLMYELDEMDRICQDNDLRYEESKAKIESQQREILELSQSLEKYKAELESKSKELIDLTEALKKCQAELESKSNELANKSNELDNKSKELENKSKELENKSKEMENKSIELENKSKELTDTKETLKKYQTELENKSKESTDSNETLRKYQTELENKSKELIDSKESSKKYQTELENKSKELTDSKESLRRYQTDLENKSKELLNSEESLKKYQNELENKSKELINSEESLKKYQTELENKSKELINSEESLKKYQTELENKSKELINSTEFLKKYQAELENESKDREKQAEERLNLEKQGAKEKVESLTENIKDLETQLQAQN
ncbi:1579_t:CDS:10, partial [Scutellospora calospora]